MLPRRTGVAGHVIVTTGAFRSILLPEIGPPVAELPTASATFLVPVRALLVSAPSAIVVEREKLASVVGVTPEPPSVAVQAISTLSLCHMPSAEPQEIAGAFLSTFRPEIASVVTELPTPSVSSFVPVAALLVSVPPATLVESANSLSVAGARPDPPSAAEQSTVMSVADHVLGAVRRVGWRLLVDLDAADRPGDGCSRRYRRPCGCLSTRCSFRYRRRRSCSG